MANDDQSVLRLRLATLSRNLKQVSDTATSVAQRRSDVRILAELFDISDGVQQSGQLLKNIAACKEMVEGFGTAGRASLRQYNDLRRDLEKCEEFAEGLEERAKRSERFVNMMARRWANLSPDDNFDDHIKEIFGSRADALIEDIGQLNGMVPTEAWRVFQERIRASSEDLFSEYVDFLGGVALRDTGLCTPIPAVIEDGEDHPAEQFAPDVYAMADDLVRQIYLIGQDLWHSLTIPARRDVVAARTLARIIRLGFPEWTVWAVPLTAHEFGRVVVDKLDLVDMCASKLGGVEPGMETILADIFGAYALGPAYAFASIYVLLDPRAQRRIGEPNGEEPNGSQEHGGTLQSGPVRTDSDRAYAVLSTLEQMNEREALTGVLDDLRSRWTTAVEQAQGVALPTGNEAEQLDAIVSLLLPRLRYVAPSVQFMASRWALIANWEPLAELVTDEEWGLQAGREDVRDILNAAWLQRLDARPLLDTTADGALADAALALWRRDLEGRRPGDGPTSQRRRR